MNDLDALNAELRRKAIEAGAVIPEGSIALPDHEYVTHDDILSTARTLAQGFTQTQIAEALGVDQSAVSRAFKGHSSYIKILMRWIEMRYPSVDPDVEFEKGAEGEPVRYYRMNYVRQE